MVDLVADWGPHQAVADRGPHQAVARLHLLVASPVAALLKQTDSVLFFLLVLGGLLTDHCALLIIMLLCRHFSAAGASVVEGSPA